MASYRRPGVYLEESLLVNPSDVAGTVTVGAFVGVAAKGQLNEPVLIESWSDYVTLFGGFDPIQPPDRRPQRPHRRSARSADVRQPRRPQGGRHRWRRPLHRPGLRRWRLRHAARRLQGQRHRHRWCQRVVGGRRHGHADALVVPPKVLSYLPYAVYSFFQNGGRYCWVIRSAPTASADAGTASTIAVNGAITGGPQPDVVHRHRPLGGHLGQQPQVLAGHAGHGGIRADGRGRLRPPGAAQEQRRRVRDGGDVHRPVGDRHALGLTPGRLGAQRPLLRQPVHPDHRAQHPAAAAASRARRSRWPVASTPASPTSPHCGPRP